MSLTMIDESEVIRVIRDESVLIDKGAIGELYETALKFVGLGVGGILYTAGKQGGLRGAHLLHERLNLDGDALFDAAMIAFNTSGWGAATLRHENGKVRVSIGESALARSLSRKKRPVCHPLAGYMAGFFEQAWHRQVKVREVECLAVGDAACVFEVEG